MGPVMALLNKHHLNFEHIPVGYDHMATLLRAVDEEIISNTRGKEVLEMLWKKAEDPMEIIDRCNMRQITDAVTIRAWINEVLQSHATQVAQFVAGEEKLHGFFVGQLMKKSSGTVHPGLAQTMMLAALREQN
jgi:aspartyl-tRNA(Asn)/glutamyl-tRNA(Gln) amidotransferase subunit B